MTALSHPTLSRRSALLAGAGVMAATGLAACSGSSSSSKTLKIAVPSGWDEGVAVSNLFSVVLSDMDYKVTLSEADIGVTFTGLSKGDYDLMLDSWLPTTHAAYMEKYKSDLEDLGTWYNEAKLALAVNNSAPITSIKELAGAAADFNNEIVGIDAGAGLTQITQDEVIPGYGLDSMSFKISSTAAMLSALDGAMKSGKNIVVTLWSPHWAYTAYDIRDLEDPDGLYGAAEQIHSLGRKDFTKDFPEVAEMVKGFRLTSEQLSDLENLMINENKGKDNEKSARTWLEKNPDVRAAMETPGASSSADSTASASASASAG